MFPGIFMALHLHKWTCSWQKIISLVDSQKDLREKYLICLENCLDNGGMWSLSGVNDKGPSKYSMSVSMYHGISTLSFDPYRWFGLVEFASQEAFKGRRWVQLGYDVSKNEELCWSNSDFLKEMSLHDVRLDLRPHMEWVDGKWVCCYCIWDNK